MKPVVLLECKHLRACDDHFASLVSDSDMLLGDISLDEEEVVHLSALISAELENEFLAVGSSLSVAVFLVAMGIMSYQDGNYWTAVYNALVLPQGQLKWQTQLGETFLRVVKRYKLLEIDTTDRQRYITPILAHGYVPDTYLENFIQDGVLAIYKERDRSGLSVERAEIEHLVSIWRRDYIGYERLHLDIAELERDENFLTIALETFNNMDKVLRYEKLLARQKDSYELTALLNLPEDWLEKSAVERNELQHRYNHLCSLLEQAQGIVESSEALYSKIDELERQISTAALDIFQCWELPLDNRILDVSVKETELLFHKYLSGLSMYSGSFGWLFRLLFPKRFRENEETKKDIVDMFDPLILRDDLFLPSSDWSQLPESVALLQQLLRQREELVLAVEQYERSQQEVGAEFDGAEHLEDPQELRDKLDAKIEEIAAYKMSLVKLGRGSYEDGETLVSEQREVRKELFILRGDVSGNLDTMLACLPKVEKYKNDIELRNSLVRVRKKKGELQNKLRLYKNPLYSLNESVRVFIFQGGDKAVSFVYNSLLLLQCLDNGANTGGVVLPKRIARAMEDWWERVGRELLEEARTEQTLTRGRQTGGSYVRKPTVRFDPQARTVMACLPEQPLDFDQLSDTGAAFYVRGESGQIWDSVVPVRRLADNIYQTEAVELVLESPAAVYNLEFTSGALSRPWQITGPGWNRFCMLFSSRGDLVESGRLPDDGAWIIAPTGCNVEPRSAVKEQERLYDQWSGYDCLYVELCGIDVLMIRAGNEIDVFKRQSRLDPMFLGGEVLAGVKGDDDAPVCKGSLPGLVFSVPDSEALPLYGVKVEFDGGFRYESVDHLSPVLSKDNVVFVDINELRNGTFGLCKVTLSHRNQKVWGGSCTVVPDLQISFDQPVYRPVVEPETGRVSVSSGHPFKFSTTPPAVAAEISGGRFSATFDTSLVIVSGELAYNLGAGKWARMNIYIDTPCVRWRWAGERDWIAAIQEIWHGDLGEIEVKVPASVEGQVHLSLEGGKQNISRPIKNGITVFNLNRFTDSLRDSGLAVQDITLAFKTSSILPLVLMEVRTRWQAAKIRIEDREEAEKRIVRLEWEDWGRAVDRVVRLWPLDMPNAKVCQYSVDDGVSQLQIEENIRELPPGSYRLEFSMEDPWSNAIPYRPEMGAENCKDVRIGLGLDEKELLMAGDCLDIGAFDLENKTFLLEKRYWIEDIEVVAELFEGEMRYRGIVWTLDDGGKPVALDCNPVSFYFEGNFLPFLVDKDREGAMFCTKCRKLYWDFIHPVCPRENQLMPENIYVRVRRQEDELRPIKGD